MTFCPFVRFDTRNCRLSSRFDTHIHSPKCTRIAWIAYSRSARAPLPEFWSPRSAHGPPCLIERSRTGATP
eukprot:5370392-Pleurochrysis_carterae.AAC.1